MAAPRKPCPYPSGEELRAAIVAAGSLDALAHEIGSSPNTLRRWCRDLGVETRTGKLGRRSDCPYTDPEELRKDVEEAGGISAFALARGNDPRTVRRWMREVGIEPEGRKRSDGGEVLSRMEDAELEALVSAVGPAALGRILDLSADAVRVECKRRGVGSSASASPRAQMLARRVRDLEKREEALAELRAEIRHAAEIAGAKPPPSLPDVDLSKRTRHGDLEVVVHVSDMQYGEHVDSEEVPGGRYSPAVFEEERLPRYLEAVEALIQNAAELGPLRRVWIAQGGDFVEGHEVFAGSSAWHLDEGYDAGTQVVRLSQVWANAVARIATRAKSVGAETWVVSVVGNHGVHGGRKAGAVPPSLNYDYLTYEMVRAHLAGMPGHGGVDYYDREARRAVYFETVGGLVAMTHGQEDRGGGIVGVPITTGYRNSMSARLSLDGVDPILELKGHYHRPMSLTIAADRVTAWNGAWIGANNLSVGRGGASSPSQNLHVLHAEHGLIATHRVKLAGRVEAPVEVIG